MKFAILGISGIIIALWFLNSEKGAKNEIVLPKSMQAEAPPTEITNHNESRVERVNQIAKIKRERYLAEKNLGIVSQSFPSPKEGLIQVGVSFAPKSKWCENGDFDYMKAHLLHNSDKQLVVSVEELGDSRRVLGQKVLDLEQMKSARPIVLDVKTSKENRLAGLFICSSPSGSKQRCQGKRNIDFAKLENAAVKDNMSFYFQGIYLKENQVKVPPTLANNGDRKFYQSLASITDQSQHSGLSLVDKNTRSLGSIPFKFYPNEIVITLPYNDPRCKQQKQARK
ncbi:MAG: hypothetical protein ACOH5I_22120 [Oligoflexus sp.]